MANGLNFVAKELAIRNKHSIKFSACTDAKVPVVDVMEAICGVSNLLLSGCIPWPCHLIGVHAVGEIKRRIYINIIKQRETPADWDAVLHAIAPVFDEIWMEKSVFFRVDWIADLSCIAYRNLLIPAFCPDSMTSFERIKTAQTDVQVRQSEGYTRITHVLIQVGCGAEW